MASTNKRGIITAVLTMSLLIPAGWHTLNAGGPRGNPEARPAERTLKLADAQVVVSVDRPSVPAGERVHVALSARSDRLAQVDVDIALMAQEGPMFARVATPPVTVASRRLALPADGSTKEVSFVLEGAKVDGDDPLRSAGAIKLYTLMVTKASDQKAKGGSRREVWNPLGGVDEAAMVQVVACQPTAYDVELSHDTIRGKTVTGRVVVRNTSKKTLKGLNVHLGSSPFMALSLGNDPPTAWSIEWAEGHNGQIAELAPGAAKTLHFKATCQSDTVKGSIFANVWASYGGRSSGELRFDDDSSLTAGRALALRLPQR